jgi:hypothetical protein
MSARRRAARERRERVAAMRAGGATLTAIGRELGIGEARVRQLLLRHTRELARAARAAASPDTIESLTDVRAYNVLRKAGLGPGATRAEVRAHLATLPGGALYVRNCGIATYRRIAEWLGHGG